MSDSSRPHGLQPTRLLRPWDFPGRSTGVGCHSFLKFLIMHFNTSALDSFSPILLIFSDFLILFLFILSTKFLVPYALLIFPLKHLNCHSTSFLTGVRRVLPARSPREKGGWHVFICQLAWPNQNDTWSKTVSLLTFKVSFSLLGLIRCR